MTKSSAEIHQEITGRLTEVINYFLEENPEIFIGQIKIVNEEINGKMKFEKVYVSLVKQPERIL